MKIEIKDQHDLSTIEIIKKLELLFLVCPPKNNAPDYDEIITNGNFQQQDSFHKVILCYENKDLIGHAEIFQRDIVIGSNIIPVLALAGVCVNPLFRKRKIGSKMIKEAFKYIDSGTFKVCIFQTNVPEFYYKLNCKLINNKFINSKSYSNIGTNPWRDPNIMIYPKNYKLSNETIDLNGECY